MSAHKPSDKITIFLEEPTVQAGRITRVSPGRQHPSKKIQLTVDNIANNPLTWWAPVAPDGLPYPSPAVTVSPGLLEAMVPGGATPRAR